MEILGKDLEPTAADRIKVIDLTLRDGEQAAGVIFSLQEKLDIANLLSYLGVHQFEVGCPWLADDEFENIKAVVAAHPDKAIGFCRALEDDVRAAAKAGIKTVVISLATSDLLIQRKFGRTREWVLDRMLSTAKEASKHGMNFIISAEDASRSDPEFLSSYYRAALAAGAMRVRFCDTTSVLNPLDTYGLIAGLVEKIGGKIEMHTHNDFGMATANSLAGLRAGADYVTVSIGGLGERTGCAALEEVVMALKHVQGVSLPIATDRFREIAEYVANASSRAIPIWKAIVGTNIFAHESGIHADGVIKNPRTYEAFSPEEVGLQRQLVVGKHSGSHTISHKFALEFGIELTDEQATAILAKTRSMAVRLKRALFEKELMLIYNELYKDGGQER